MRKFKILVPLTCVLATTSMVAPVLSSCGNNQKYKSVVPTDLLDIDGSTLKGFKEDADISKYDTLEIPSNVRIIGINAFGDKNNSNSKIKKLVIPSSVSEIKDYAFAGLTNLQYIDLSALDTDNAHRIEIASGSFGLSNLSRYVPIKLNDNLSDIAKEYLTEKLTEAGVPETWFTLPTSGHVEFSGEKQVENDAVATVNYNVKLAEIPVELDNVEVLLQKTGGTDGLNVELTESTINSIDRDISFGAGMVIESGHKLANGEFVEYNATIISRNSSNIKWIEVIDGLKLTYVGNGNVEVTGVELDIHSRSCGLGEEIYLYPTVTPKNATDKTLKWKSSDPTVATVDDDGKITGISGGEATITCTTANGKFADTCKINVEVDTNMFMFMPLISHNDPEVIEGYSAVLTTMNMTPEEIESLTKIAIPDEYEGMFGKKPVISVTKESDTTSFPSLEEVRIGNNIETIMPETFFKSSIKKITYGNSPKLKTIGQCAFSACSQLEYIHLPDSVVNVSRDAFSDCPKIKKTRTESVMYLCLTDKNGENPNNYGLAFEWNILPNADVSFDDNCEIICANPNSFMPLINKKIDVTYYNSLTLGNKIRGIGDGAFYGRGIWTTKEAASLKLPNSLKYIGKYSFAYLIGNGNNVDTPLVDVTFPEGLIEIAPGAFTASMLGDVVIPKSVKYISRRPVVALPDKALDKMFQTKTFDYTFTLEDVASSKLIPLMVGSFDCATIKSLKFTKDSELLVLGKNAFFNTTVLSFAVKPTLELPQKVEELCEASLAFNSLPVKDSDEGALQIEIPSSVIKMQTPFFNEIMKSEKLEIIDPDIIDLSFADTKNTWSGYYLIMRARLTPSRNISILNSAAPAPTYTESGLEKTIFSNSLRPDKLIGLMYIEGFKRNYLILSKNSK